jgi:uncharacterized protein (DUF885 family)
MNRNSPLLIFILFLVTPLLSMGDDLETRRKSLDKLLSEYWEYTLRADPFTASELGDKRWNDQLPDLSLAGWNERFETESQFLKRFEAINTSGFPEQEAINKQLIIRELKNSSDGKKFGRHLMPVNQFWGIHIQAAELAFNLSFQEVKDYEDFTKRLRGYPVLFAQVEEVLRAGMKENLVPPKFLLEKVVEQSQYITQMEPMETPFASPLQKMPESFSDDDRIRIREALIHAIRDQVIPTYQKFADFIEQEYAPSGNKEVGAWALPNGKERYAWLVRLRTTTDKTPEEIHQLGLREVARIESEMLKIAKQLGYPDVKSLDAELQTKSEFRAQSREQILDLYREYISRMEAKLPALFGRLPNAKLIIMQMEGFREREAAGAQYEPGAPDGSRPGRVLVNTYKPQERNVKFIEATAYHEGHPGHHLQTAIQQELPELPPFRQVIPNDAFREGWALYAESLGKDVGFYQDPYSDYGRLQNEMLRAIRLVVDTGLHFKQWNRQQVLEYFRLHSAMEEVTIQSETDRYIAWPAQALTYKTGELKILELRERAKTRLKDHFDIRKFHDQVLNAGALPLTILETRIDDWIDRESG